MNVLKKVKTVGPFFLVFFVAFGIFANTLFHEFVWDDFIYIVYRTEKSTELNIANVLSGKYPRNDTGVFRPGRNIFDVVSFAFFETNPRPYHFFVVSLHAVLSVMVYWLVLEITKQKRTALITGILFGLHPIHVEAVAWVMAGLDLLFVLFYIPSMVFYIKSERENDKNLLKWSWILAGIAMSINELALTMPIMIMMIDYFVFNKKVSELIVSTKLKGYLFVFGTYWLLRFYFLERVGQAAYVYDNFFDNFLLVVTMFAQYIRYLVLPIGLVVDHLFPNGLTSLFVQNYDNNFPPPIIAISQPWVLVSVLVSTSTLILAWLIRKIKPLISFGLLWLWITLLPGLGVIPIVGIFAERRAYLASVGFVMITALVIEEIYSRKKIKFVAIGLIAAIAVWYGWLTFDRNGVWKDSKSLWSHTYENNHMSAVAAHSMATNYSIEKQYEKALPYALIAIKLDPYGGTFQETLNSLYVNLKMWNELADYYDFYIEKDPKNADLLFRAGTLYENEFKDYKKAREFYKRVLDVLPENKQAIEAIKNLDNKNL